ncbi:MAG: alcohol dehydrogenase catalytic domain-containing protein [Aigarchaeota archaeon]|nr:alcohol dehydrogenase catalytic domain-containing protein [Aigarchaeota archaeon]MCX8193461.1 alcohol dehydrogenase catalytic domain-containing protein [Nitrososphaeria archaeon]MDW7985807.1 alcohol dehydrogenase catalytic domain-containing protein [Nitrososphaerota archaeon]
MRAVVLREFHSPLKVEEVKDITELRKDEVILKIEMTGICYRDILTVDGYFPKTRIPIIIGHEICGRVVDVGEGVEEFKKGERVAGLTYIPCGSCRECTQGHENICRKRLWFGEDIDGSYAEYLKTNYRSLVKTSEDISPEAVAISACVVGMLIHALKARGGLTEGEKVLITGASGGVGVHAIQLAKAYGAEVIAVTGREEYTDRLYGLGADYIIISRDGLFSNEVKKHTREVGVDLVLDCVGLTLIESLKSVKWGGRIIQVGNIKPEPIPLMTGQLILKEIVIYGSISCTKKELAEALRLLEKGVVKPIATVLPLDNVEEGHRIVKERKHFGRVLLKP